MNKNKFLTAFAVTMLGSCAGFAMDLGDDADIGLSSSSSAGLLVTPAKTIVPLQLGEHTYSVTPNTKARVESMVEKTPAIVHKVKSGFAGKSMPERQRERAINSAIQHEKTIRDANMDSAHAIASGKDKEIKSNATKKKAFASAEKHKKSRENQAEKLISLEQELFKEQSKSELLNLQVTSVNEEKDRLSALIERALKEKNTLSGELEQLTSAFEELKDDAGFDQEELAMKQRQIEQLTALLLEKTGKIISLQNNLAQVELDKETAEIYMNAARERVAIPSASADEEEQFEEGLSGNDEEEGSGSDEENGSDNEENSQKPAEFSLEDDDA